jgi:hypothetical protein
MAEPWAGQLAVWVTSYSFWKALSFWSANQIRRSKIQYFFSKMVRHHTEALVWWILCPDICIEQYYDFTCLEIRRAEHQIRHLWLKRHLFLSIYLHLSHLDSWIKINDSATFFTALSLCVFHMWRQALHYSLVTVSIFCSLSFMC